MKKNVKIENEEKDYLKTDSLSFQDFILKLKDTITSSTNNNIILILDLIIFQEYDSAPDKSRQVVVVINKMNELKELNNEYLNRI